MPSARWPGRPRPPTAETSPSSSALRRCGPSSASRPRRHAPSSTKRAPARHRGAHLEVTQSGTSSAAGPCPGLRSLARRLPAPVRDSATGGPTGQAALDFHPSRKAQLEAGVLPRWIGEATLGGDALLLAGDCSGRCHSRWRSRESSEAIASACRAPLLLGVATRSRTRPSVPSIWLRPIAEAMVRRRSRSQQSRRQLIDEPRLVLLDAPAPLLHESEVDTLAGERPDDVR